MGINPSAVLEYVSESAAPIIRNVYCQHEAILNQPSTTPINIQFYYP